MIDPQQRRLAAAALAVAGEHGFALAGGLALAAHGVGARPSDDIDLFTSNIDPAAFSAAVDAIHDAFVARPARGRRRHRTRARRRRRRRLQGRRAVRTRRGARLRRRPRDRPVRALHPRDRPVLALADEREVHPLDRTFLADRLAQATHLQERDLAPYLDPETAAALRAWFTQWSHDMGHDGPGL